MSSIFRKNNKNKDKTQIIGSIKNIPNYEEFIIFISDQYNTKYIKNINSIEFIKTPKIEYIVDNEHLSMIYPSSVNSYINFSDYTSMKINKLNVGNDEKGIKLIGYNKTVVNRKYVDGFIKCMNNLYGIKSTEIETMVHKNKSYPMFLISSFVSIILSPINIESDSWIKEEYLSQQKFSNSKNIITNICPYCGFPIPNTEIKCSHCGGPNKGL